MRKPSLGLVSLLLGIATVHWKPAFEGEARWSRLSGQPDQAAVRQKAGRIATGGMRREVTLEPVAGAINDRIDDAYRAKYRASPYLDPMISARARAATVKIMPRNAIRV